MVTGHKRLGWGASTHQPIQSNQSNAITTPHASAPATHLRNNDEVGPGQRHHLDVLWVMAVVADRHPHLANRCYIDGRPNTVELTAWSRNPTSMIRVSRTGVKDGGTDVSRRVVILFVEALVCPLIV